MARDRNPEEEVRTKMAKAPIRVGIIGANPSNSWAAQAHVPAIQRLAGFDLVALATTNMASAKAAGEKWNVDHVYDDYRAMIDNPDVDLVIVAVKVPHHKEMAVAALAAGKHVYCEWPLGRSLQEARDMTQAAASAQGMAFAGTQGVSSPTIRYVRDLVDEGYVGRIRSISMIASGMAWGPVIDQANAYSLDKTVGATILSVPFGHAMAAIETIAGLPTDVSARIAYQRTQAIIAETGEQIPMTSPDQLLVTAEMPDDVVFSAHFRGGISRSTNLLLEINGEEGDLQITGSAGHIQMFPLELLAGRRDQHVVERMQVPSSYFETDWVEESFPLNVLHAYAALERDIREGGHTCPRFDDALRLHRLISAIKRSASTGRRERLDGRTP